MPKLQSKLDGPNNRIASPDGSKRHKSKPSTKHTSSPQRSTDPSRLLHEIPEPPEDLGRESPYTDINHALIWWDKYWQLLLDSDQAVGDFVPAIVTLCSFRQDICEMDEGLRQFKIHTKIGQSLARSKLTIAKTMLALEGTFGFTLATNDIREKDVKRRQSKEENPVPSSVNLLAARTTESNPYVLTDDDDGACPLFATDVEE
jgi:hypothetical protein